MNPKVLVLLWANRAKIYAAAKGLHWSRRTWTIVGGVAAVALGLYWVATNVRLVAPADWPPVQWVLLVVDIVGFVWLYLLIRGWYARQDDVLDDVDRLRSEVASLAGFVHDHEHDVVEAEEPEPEEPEETVERVLGGRSFTFRA